MAGAGNIAKLQPVAAGAVSSPASAKLLMAALVAFAALFPLLHLAIGGLNYWLHMLLFIYMNVAITSSWNIMGGFAGYISLGHNVFFAIGGYFSDILFAYFGVSPFVSTPLAGVAAMVAGLLSGTITVRLRGRSFVSTSIAIVVLPKIVLNN